MFVHQFKRLQLYSGILGIFVIWTGIIIGMSRVHLGLLDSRPISYLGVNTASRSVFSLCLILSALLFFAFGYYINSKFKIKNKFLLYFTIGQIAQIIAAVVPDTNNSPYKIVHTVAAFILAISLPFLIREFARSQSGKRRSKIYNRLSHLEQLTFVIGIGLFIFTSGVAPLGEALPAVGFHIWIIVLTFLILIDGKKIFSSSKT